MFYCDAFVNFFVNVVGDTGCIFAISSMSLMRFAANFLGSEGGAAVARSLTALTALQTLNLQCIDAVVLFFVCLLL